MIRSSSSDNCDSNSPLKAITTEARDSPVDAMMKNWATSTRPGIARKATDDLENVDIEIMSK